MILYNFEYQQLLVFSFPTNLPLLAYDFISVTNNALWKCKKNILITFIFVVPLFLFYFHAAWSGNNKFGKCHCRLLCFYRRMYNCYHICRYHGWRHCTKRKHLLGECWSRISQLQWSLGRTSIVWVYYGWSGT